MLKIAVVDETNLETRLMIPRRQLEPQIILQFEVEIGKANYSFAEETLSAHALTAVYPNTKTKAVDILCR